MKNIISKFGSFFGFAIAVFFAGASYKKNKLKNKRLKEEYEQFIKNAKIKKDLNSMSISDKSKFLLSKQKNNK